MGHTDVLKSLKKVIIFPSKTTDLERVHFDFVDLKLTNSLAVSKYILTYLDDYSRKSFIYFLKSKDQVTAYFTS